MRRRETARREPLPAANAGGTGHTGGQGVKPSIENEESRMSFPMKYIVSHQHEFVYFVIPKVACSSVKASLMPLLDIYDEDTLGTVSKNGTLAYEVHGLVNRSGLVRRKSRFLRELEGGEYRNYFKFAFVRNPYDRLVSCYLQKIAEGGQGLTKQDYGNIKIPVGMPFGEFVEAVHAIPDEESDVHFRSQYLTVCGPGPEREIMANFLGRFENLREDFETVVKGIDPIKKIELLHLWPSKSRHSRHYAEFYDKGLQKLVYERYQQDLETFGYSFQGSL